LLPRSLTHFLKKRYPVQSLVRLRSANYQALAQLQGDKLKPPPMSDRVPTATAIKAFVPVRTFLLWSFVQLISCTRLCEACLAAGSATAKLKAQPKAKANPSAKNAIEMHRMIQTAISSIILKSKTPSMLPSRNVAASRHLLRLSLVTVTATRHQRILVLLSLPVHVANRRAPKRRLLAQTKLRSLRPCSGDIAICW
jgi:hypothetical protein